MLANRVRSGSVINSSLLEWSFKNKINLPSRIFNVIFEVEYEGGLIRFKQVNTNPTIGEMSFIKEDSTIIRVYTESFFGVPSWESESFKKIILEKEATGDFRIFLEENAVKK